MDEQAFTSRELMQDMDGLLFQFQKNPELRAQFEKDPKSVLIKALPGKGELIAKKWDSNVETSLNNLISNAKSMDPSSEVATTLAFAAFALYVVWAWAAKTMSPFSYSEHPMILKEEKIRELLEKEIISKDDLIKEGHRGL